MKINIALAFSVLGVIAAASTASAQVQLTMQGGHVTLSAKDATIRQILAEWERVGETKVVNGERSPGGLVTLELPDMPEQQALDIILRSASGVLFAPRTEAAAGNVSAFAQIILMPPSVAPPPSPARPRRRRRLRSGSRRSTRSSCRSSSNRSSSSSQQPQFQQPLQFQPPPPVSDDDDRPTVAQPRPVFVFPQPQITNPQAVPAGGAMPQQVAAVDVPARCGHQSAGGGVPGRPDVCHAGRSVRPGDDGPGAGATARAAWLCSPAATGTAADQSVTSRVVSQTFVAIRPAMHPAWRRCSSVTDLRSTPSSRPANPAPRRASCDNELLERDTSWL